MAIPIDKSHGGNTRVVVFVPIEMGFLLTLVSRYRNCTKKSLHAEIWEAGVQALLGVDPSAVEATQPSPLPRSTTPPADLHKLVKALVGQA